MALFLLENSHSLNIIRKPKKSPFSKRKRAITNRTVNVKYTVIELILYLMVHSIVLKFEKIWLCHTLNIIRKPKKSLHVFSNRHIYRSWVMVLFICPSRDGPYNVIGYGGRAGVHTGFRTITLVLYIGSLPNLARGRTLFILIKSSKLIWHNKSASIMSRDKGFHPQC
jgi:hypothetical protein